jgi:DnaJ-class molecular chaperone
MKVLTDKSNNLNIQTEESQSDNEDGEQNLIGSKKEVNELCPDCHGSGSLQNNTCSSCNGKGVI